MLSQLLAASLFAAVSAEEVKHYSNYTLEELQAFSFLERVTLYDWRIESFTVTFTVVFVGLFFFGNRYNQSLVTTWLEKHRALLQAQFFQVGVHRDELYVRDDAENYSSYATGRANIAALNIQFRLKPRHNVFIFVIETIMSYFVDAVPTPLDRVEIKITPGPDANVDAFIWALVSKNGMNDHRAHNYFLSLTRTTESTDLPQEYVYMSESPEFNTLAAGLKKVLPGASRFFRFLAVTDQAQERPQALVDLVSQPKIVLSMTVPTSQKDLDASVELLGATLSLADTLASKEGKFRADVLKKILKTRDNEVAKILKIQEDIKNEELTDKRIREKREARDKLKQLSPEEQAKHEEKERKKEEKKMKKKQKKQRV
ncbi:hypothetical protein BABINDRAFT_5446 [Babjeviella inositovora NRRL Y-12698]|uniref:DUF1682-domain-containing protein n=1 Tax=Babjeviella inositovora NRRL Y-12698 TaxID=984486 RepID=A0A1E3QZH3_9ASCO|nr:uncharacterized protein BABINDRAFT_5446 [Babjeviella inositovora NRRL Y-12698]ODQ82487.1 hypothetical protein BABINDRAFT_5446 [Babjeviella inositovora NRRL Y-12698]